ncbi:MAG: MOSC domain-containing protein [Nitrospira sp.]|nr:MOSC domain-containing protein [Nitrospira sp.]
MCGRSGLNALDNRDVQALYPGPDPAWPSANLRDGQADLVHHGGVDKAVCAYPSEHWLYWRGILPPHRLTGGAFGENFTLEGFYGSRQPYRRCLFSRVRPSCRFLNPDSPAGNSPVAGRSKIWRYKWNAPASQAGISGSSRLCH